MLTFKEFLVELSSAQAARFSVKPKAERMKMAQMSDRDAKVELQKQIQGMEQSTDADEKLLARKMKEVAALQMKVRTKKEQADKMKQQQAGNQMGTGQPVGTTGGPGIPGY